MALDILAVDDYLMLPIRRTAKEHGIGTHRMMVNTSHSHSGPNMTPCRSLVTGYNEDYLQWCRDAICGLIPTALVDLQEATLDYTVGSCTMAIYRRRVPDGRDIPHMLPNPDEPIDPDVPVLRILRPDGSPRAVIFSYACHPSTVMIPTINAEYPGYARETIEAKIPDCRAVFLQGCGGDTKPRNITSDFTFGLDSLEPVRKLGHELGRAVLAAVCGEPKPLSDELAANSEFLQVPFDHQPTDDEIQEMKEEGGLSELWADTVRRVYDSGHMPPMQWPIEVQIFNLGGLIILGMAAEICRDVGMHIKDRLADCTVCTLGYCNGGWDYFASRDTMTHPAYSRGYEARISFRDTVWPCAQPLGWAPEAEDLLLDTIERMVRDIA